MKIVCTNQESCGRTEKLKDLSQKEPSKVATVCTYCGSLALYYSNEYKPIFHKDYTSLDIENIFIEMYLKILYKKGKYDANNK